MSRYFYLIVLFLSLLALVLILYIWKYNSNTTDLIYPKSDNLEKSSEEKCGTLYKEAPFETATFKDCGLVQSNDDRLLILGKLDKVILSNNTASLMVTYLDNEKKVISSEFTLGELNSSYTFITLQKNFTNYSVEDDSKYLQEIITEELVNTLRGKVGQYIIMSIMKDPSTIINLNIDEVESKYQQDVLYRKNYYSNCKKNQSNVVDINDIRKNCQFIFKIGRAHV